MRRVLIAVALGLAFMVAPVAAASAAETATVPVVVRATTLGVNNSPTPVASSAIVPASAAHLMVYSTTSGYLQILGPKNLDCQGGIAADGNGSITASPSGDSQDLGHDGVEAIVYPACVGCMLTLACPFFPAALRALRNQYRGSLSCASQPLGQTVRRLSPDAVAFSDPAGEYAPSQAESLVPSNGPYPTNGVVVYETYRYRGYLDSTAMAAACVLPASQHAVCTVVLNEFLATQVKHFT
jgi:hypothetical protein